MSATRQVEVGRDERMLRAYFDTNIFDHVAKGYIPGAVVDALRAALDSGAIAGHLSLADIEELLGQWETDRPVAVRKLRLARDLVGLAGLLKPPAELLTEAIQAYAVGSPPPAPTLPRHSRRYVAAILDKVADGSTAFNAVVSGIVAEVRESKTAFLAGMTQAGADASVELTGSETWQEAKAWAPTFPAFWEQAAPLYAEDFADRLGLADACRAHGLDGLLRVRTVRLAVGVALSLVFAQVVEGRAPDPSAGYDMWHAVLGSTANVFVTHDKAFAGHLARVPDVEGFRVRPLKTLLAELETTGDNHGAAT